MTILILGSRHDLITLRIKKYFEEKHVNHAVMWEEDLLTEIKISHLVLSKGKESYLLNCQKDLKYRLSDFSSILIRLTGFWTLPRNLSANDREYVSAELHASLLGLLHDYKGLVVNPSKPDTLQGMYLTSMHLSKFVKKYGLKIPDTEFTNDPLEAKMFMSEHNDVAQTSIVDDMIPYDQYATTRFMNKLVHVPIRLVKKIAGIPFRIFVIGDNLIIDELSNSFFGRYHYEKDLRSILEKFAHKITNLMSDLNYSFATLDVISSINGIYFLNLTPYPTVSSKELNRLGIVPILANLLQRG